MKTVIVIEIPLASTKLKVELDITPKDRSVIDLGREFAQFLYHNTSNGFYEAMYQEMKKFG